MTTRGDAKLAANQANAQLSTGPITAEGKQASRRNALKHGMSGAGKVLPPDLEADFQKRHAEWVQKYQPQGDEECALVRQIALASARMHHLPILLARLETSHQRRDLACWDLDRALAASRLIARLANDPVIVVNELRRSSHGAGALISYWRALRAGLRDNGECLWSDADLSVVLDLDGIMPVLRHLDPAASSWRELVAAARAGGQQAAATLRAKVDENIEELEAHAEALRTALEVHEFANLESGYVFDTHPETIALRRLEAAASRMFFRCIRRIETLQAERLPSRVPAAAAPTSTPPRATSRLAPQPRRAPIHGVDLPPLLAADSDSDPGLDMTPEEEAEAMAIFHRLVSSPALA